MEWRLSQKDRERRFAEHFLEVFPEGALQASLVDEERPDFLLFMGQEAVGLEVREIFREPEGAVPMQAQEGGWQAVLRGCEEAWREDGRPHVEVWVGFNEGYHVPSGRVSDVAKGVLDLVKEHLPKPGTMERVMTVTQPWGTFPKEVRYLNISRLVEYERSYWHYDGIGVWVPELEPEKIQAEIDAKNDKVPTYREKASEVWLLLVVHGWRGSSMMDIPPEAVTHAYDHDFDKVFLLDTLGHQAYDLPGG